MWVSSCSLCPGLSEGEGQAGSGETVEPEAELGHCYPAEELPMPSSPQTAPCPPGESHNHSGSLPRLPGKVRSQRPGKVQPLCPCLGKQGGNVPDQNPPHVGSCPAVPGGILLLEWWMRDFPALSRGSRGNTAAVKTVIVTCLCQG